MTPNEKAQELFTDYRSLLSLPNAPLGDKKDEVAKHCALMAADECKHTVATLEQKQYWREVKHEIRNITL